MRSNHSTKVKAWGKARAANRDSGLQLQRVQAKVKTKSGTHLNLIARAQAPGKLKAEKESALERAREKVKTSSRPEIKEPLGETRPKCIPAKEPGLEEAPVTRPMR